MVRSTFEQVVPKRDDSSLAKMLATFGGFNNLSTDQQLTEEAPWVRFQI